MGDESLFGYVDRLRGVLEDLDLGVVSRVIVGAAGRVRCGRSWGM